MGQLAAKVRAKFPGAYDDIDDATLEKQVLAKHPEYADLATPEQAAPPAAPKDEWYQSKAGAIEGASRLGNAALSVFNPMTYVRAAEAKTQGDQQASDEMTQMIASGHGQPRQPWTMGRLKEIGMNTVNEAPEIVGGVLGGAAMGGAMNLAGKMVRSPAVPMVRGALKVKDTTLNQAKATDFGINSKSDIARAVLNTPGAYPSETGIANAEARAAGAHQQVTNAAKYAPPASTATALKPVQDLAGPNSVYSRQTVHAADDLSGIRGAIRDIQNHPLYSEEITPAQPADFSAGRISSTPAVRGLPPEQPSLTMLEARRATGKVMGQRTPGEVPSATTAAEQAHYTGMGNALEEASPGIKNSLQQESRAITIERALKDAANRGGNRDIVGFANAAPTALREALALFDRSITPRIGAAKGLEAIGKNLQNPAYLKALLIAKLTGQPAPKEP